MLQSRINISFIKQSESILGIRRKAFETYQRSVLPGPITLLAPWLGEDALRFEAGHQVGAPRPDGANIYNIHQLYNA